MLQICSSFTITSAVWYGRTLVGLLCLERAIFLTAVLPARYIPAVIQRSHLRVKDLCVFHYPFFSSIL